MSVIVTTWSGLDGMEYHATTLYDPETGKTWEWDGKLAKYVLLAQKLNKLGDSL